MPKGPTTEYVLRKGQEFHGFDSDGRRKTFVAGDIVPLTENQAKAFADKFDLYEEIEVRKKVKAEMDTKKAASPTAQPVKSASPPSTTNQTAGNK